jgi:hypothetical protein
MFRSSAVRATAGLAVIAAVSCSASVSRAEAVSPVASTVRCSVASLGGPSDSAPPAATASDAVMRSLASQSDAIGYQSGLSAPSCGSQLVRRASGMGFGFDTVPFESFLSVAAASNGETVVRAFIIIEDQKSKGSDSAPGQAAGDDLVNRFTQAAGTTTTSGSATLSILQVPPTSSALVYTNVVLKGAARAAE